MAGGRIVVTHLTTAAAVVVAEAAASAYYCAQSEVAATATSEGVATKTFSGSPRRTPCLPLIHSFIAELDS